MKKYLPLVLANILFIIIAGAAGYGNDVIIQDLTSIPDTWTYMKG